MKIILTIGDCNGIGIEVMLKSLDIFFQDTANNEIQIDISGNIKVIKEYARLIQYPVCTNENSLVFNKHRCNIKECQFTPKISFGKLTKEAGMLAAESIEKAVMLTKNKHYNAIVTMPVAKSSLYLAGWEFPGHTEMLAKHCQGEHLMILMNDNIRIALATIHEPILSVPNLITKELIIRKAKILHQSLLQDFNIKKPNIAILGLNPHAGEEGSIGKEDIDIIKPAIESLQNDEINANGPFPADGFFAYKEYKQYDGILAMYHDQGLIPLKILAQGRGVNFTAGINIVRTSPDHGTAFGIAGKNIADVSSTLQALYTAIAISKNRNFYQNNNLL